MRILCLLFLPACLLFFPVHLLAEDLLVLDGIPHVQQKRDFCGEACVEMACLQKGWRIDQDDVFNHAELAPKEGRGCYTRELTTAVRKLGFDTGDVGRWIEVASAKAELQSGFNQIMRDLRAGTPTIVCMRYDERPDTTEHFRLVTGFDRNTNEVIYHEPAEANGAYRRMSRDRFFSLWPLKYKRDRWLLISLPLRSKGPASVRIKPDLKSSRDAELAQRVMEVKALLARQAPRSTFHIEIRRPFVVIGDEAPAKVKARADQTVYWAVRHLKKQFFKEEPDEIYAIWLFKDKASYEAHMMALWGEKPFTPFGYFSQADGALVMNIQTGGGTLVHEIVHPFVAANFPGCAPWVDEGLASLYEQCGERGGKMKGFTNWRLAGLQLAIRRNKVPSFKTLCNTAKFEFYKRDPGTNYAQSRYLMYYLQEKGQLERFYKYYSQARDTDPTGWRSLQKILGNPDMDAFQRSWEKWVMGLTFR